MWCILQSVFNAGKWIFAKLSLMIACASLVSLKTTQCVNCWPFAIVKSQLLSNVCLNMRILIVNILNFSHNIIKLFWVFNILYLLHNFWIVHLSSQMIALRTMQRWCSITFLVKYITHYIRLCKIFYTDEFSFYIDMRWYSKCMVIFFHMVLAKI